MECRNCPYGRDDFERRVFGYSEMVEESDITDDIHEDLMPEDVADELDLFVWCEKVGGKVCQSGACSDAESEVEEPVRRSNHRKRNKWERNQKYKRHLKRLAEIAVYYPVPVRYMDQICIRGHGYIDNPKPYYKRLYRGRGRGMRYYHKKMSKRKIRRYKGDLPRRGNLSHKLYDFWWNMT